VRRLMVLHAVERHPGWQALRDLDEALAVAEEPRQASAAAARAHPDARVADAYAALVRALIAEDRADPASALAAAVLEEGNALGGLERPPQGLRAAAAADVESLQRAVRRDWHADAARLADASLPPLKQLAPEPPSGAWESGVAALAAALLSEPAEAVLEWLLDRFREHGTGAPARYGALRWRGGGLEGIAHAAAVDGELLVGVDDQLGRLYTNTEALLAGAPAHNALLYGPRGSGKSTAVRSLLPRYQERGLRLVELPGEALERLPEVVERLRRHPQRFVLYVDDLSFEHGDRRYHPLKTLLEGSLSARPGNVVLYATSNRRHLLRERFSERPAAGEDDDVHAWDTHNERLALADRFGLTITFPSASQREYLHIVEVLAGHAGVQAPDLVQRAVRFADWGNGYSGRTARQFIDAVLQERAAGRA
jgi:uncharacterized protein